MSDINQAKCWTPNAGAAQKRECNNSSEHKDNTILGSLGVGDKYPAQTSTYIG